MRSHFKMFLVAATFGTGLFLVGCQSTGAKQEASVSPTTQQAVTCTKCDVTWVKVPVDGGKGRIIGYTSRKTMVCPDCKDAVANFFASGKLQHSCASCGDSIEICKAH